MGQVYSTLFLCVAQLTPGPAHAYATPPGKLAILRDVDVWCNEGILAGNLYLVDWFTEYIFWVVPGTNDGGPTIAAWRGRQVFPYNEGEASGFYFATDGAGSNTFYIRASGYLLDLP